MSKGIGMIIMAVMMSLQAGGVILANEVQQVSTVDNQDIRDVESLKGDYMTETGEVCTINNGQSGYQLQVGNVQEGTIFYLPKNIIVFDVATKTFVNPDNIKEGMNVSIVYPKTVPMMLSLPGRCNGAQLVIIHSQTENAQMGYFNEDLINEENTLALNISEQTVIMNNLGERRVFTAEDIKNKNAMVVYSITTRSIPAQTTPSFVLIMEAGLEEVQPIENDDIEKNHTTYRSMRQVAEVNGFEVTWDNKNKVVICNRNDEEYKFAVGSNKYFYNSDEKALEKPIILEDGKVMIADLILDK